LTQKLPSIRISRHSVDTRTIRFSQHSPGSDGFRSQHRAVGQLGQRQIAFDANKGSRADGKWRRNATAHFGDHLPRHGDLLDGDLTPSAHDLRTDLQAWFVVIIQLRLPIMVNFADLLKLFLNYLER
jgi:hypothetical protein